MYEPNVARVLSQLTPTDRVLDIGGWARPFNRADVVIDAEPWETRGFYGASRPAQGGDRERFTRDSWVQRDICHHVPFPFPDKYFDYVVCSHTLEDIRDPLWVCSEIVRVGRRGYVEVPSRMAETCRGVEPGLVGWSHHRWLVDIAGSRVRFTMKYHRIHSHWRLSFPRSVLAAMPEREQVQWLFWDDHFEFDEVTIHGVDAIDSALESYVRLVRPYPQWLVATDAVARQGLSLGARAARKAGRMFGRASAPPGADDGKG